MSENIEVVSSHIGMAVHPAVLYAVAERLAQPEGGWQPFERRGWRAAVYPRAWDMIEPSRHDTRT